MSNELRPTLKQSVGVPMTFTTIDDPVDWVRGRPEMYFRTGKPAELELAQWVWSDAVLSGCGEVLIHRAGSIWVIAASANWLIEKTYSASDLFVHVVPLAAGGPNSMRSEILLNAFCTEVVAVVGPTPAFVKGTGLVRIELDALMQRSGLAAAIGFRI